MTFEEWDPDILKEEEGVDGDNHDLTNLASQEMSKFVCRLCIPSNVQCYSIHFIWMLGSSQYHQTCKRSSDLKEVFISKHWTSELLGTVQISHMFFSRLHNNATYLLFLH